MTTHAKIKSAQNPAKSSLFSKCFGGKKREIEGILREVTYLRESCGIVSGKLQDSCKKVAEHLRESCLAFYITAGFIIKENLL